MSHRGLYRAYLEKVAGEYQGGVLNFSGGLEVGVHRLRAGINGEIYFGGMRSDLYGYPSVADSNFGLQKLTPNNTVSFEILKAHSRALGMELEFTLPVGPTAEILTNYTVQQWWYKPSLSSFPNGKTDQKTYTIKSVRVSPDRKRVFLEIPGLKTHQVVYIQTQNLVSEGNKTLWCPKTWYTLNAISPSEPFEVPTDIMTTANTTTQTQLRIQRVAGKLLLELPKGPVFNIDLVDFKGKHVIELEGVRNKVEISTVTFPGGIYFLRAAGRGQILTRRVCF